MSVKHLRSWKITSNEPFYPINLQCTKSKDTVAVTTYGAHTLNTFLFHNFSDAIKNGKPANKCHLHESLYPERIIDFARVNVENVILLDNGRIKYFKSLKRLLIVDYLIGVKTICRHENGFALIKTSMDGTEFFVEIHPDSFPCNESYNRKIYNISFDRIPELQSTWHQNAFKLKELHFDSSNNRFMALLFPEEFTVNNKATNNFLFLAIDQNFCSLHLSLEDHIVNPIVMCTSKIIDFWIGTSGDHILLMLECGTMEILSFNETSNEIARQNLYFGCEILTFRYSNGVFYYSNGSNVYYGVIEYHKEYEKYIFNRKSIDLPGIVAFDFLSQFQGILCVSENRQFYIISTQSNNNENCEWLEIDESIQRKLTNLKYQLVELSDAHDNLLKQQQYQQHMLDVIKLKRNDLKAIEEGSDELKYRFVATCSVTQSPKIQHHNDLFTNVISIKNSLVYDRNKSFFINITIATVTYANEFSSNLWYVHCRWMNDKYENEYANYCLSDMLSTPILLIIHLQQQRLPVFHMNISTIIRTGNSSMEINFPIQVNQPDYCDIMHVVKSISNSMPTESHFNEIVCSVFVPNMISIDELLADKLKPSSEHIKIKQSNDIKQCIYSVYLLNRTLTAVHYPEKEILELRSSDANMVNSFKMHIHRKIDMKLNASNQKLDVHVSADTLKEYCVS